MTDHYIYARPWSERREHPGGPGGVQPAPLGIESHSSARSDWHPPLLDPSQLAWHPPMLIPSKYSRAELGAGEDELDVLREVYGGVLNASGKLVYALGSDKRAYHTEQYLDDRAAYFGSTQNYLDYLEVARGELDAEDGKLRNKLDPSNMKPNPLPRRWRDGQAPFYAWTRRAYENRLGAGVNVPALINAGMSKALEAALRQVRADYKGGFNPQGFSARPIKTPKGYRLGTLSDHGLGTAIDISPGTNPQLEAAQWTQILGYTSKSLDVGTRRTQWVSTPSALHTAIQEISQSFARQVSAALDAHEQANPDRPEAEALAAVVAADTHLKQLGPVFVKKWQRGFFDLPWALVKELHEEKFIWGATFDRLDLHHFELP